MAEFDVTQQVDEILAALETAGKIQQWLEERKERDSEVVEQIYREATNRLLSSGPPQTGHWDHLLSATANRTTRRDVQHEIVACKAAINRLTEMLEDDSFKNASTDQAVMIASALVLALTAQRRLRQPVEISIRSLCERFPNAISEIAEQCQGIWQRRGQMSGADGLFVWDSRRSEWRLNQDFKPFRPA